MTAAQPRDSDLRGPVVLVSDTTEFAGAELYTVVLVEQLRKACDFVAVLGDGAAEETRTRLAAVGAEVRVVRGLRRRPAPTDLRRVEQAIRGLDPALLHVNLSDQGDGLAALLAAGRIGKPSVATLNLVLPGRSRWRERLSTALLRRVDRIIAGSNSTGAYLARHRIPFAVVKYGLPPPEPVPDPRAALGLGQSAFVVGGVGRLHEQKGWDVLCRAASLVGTRPEITFVVIGDGPERDRLQALEDCAYVRFVGRRSQASSLMKAFDVLVVPSRYEALGLTAVEAMFLGVPVIASSVDGLEEAVGDCALLVPADDPNALAQAILRMETDADLRSSLAEHGRQRAHDSFDVDRMAQETLALYRAVAARPGPVATLAPVSANAERHAGERQ